MKGKGKAAKKAAKKESKKSAKTKEVEEVVLNDSDGCGLCGVTSMESTQRMVQCDKCDEFYHFICVGIKDIADEEPWMCQKCRLEETNDKELSKSEANTSNTISQMDLNATTPVSISLSMPRQLTVPLQVHVDRSSEIERGSNSSEKQTVSTQQLAITAKSRPNKDDIVDYDLIEKDNASDGDLRRTVTQPTITSQFERAVRNDKITSTRVASVRSEDPNIRSATSKLQAIDLKALSNSSKSRSTTSSNRRRDIELQRMQEELDLQTNLDAETLALRLEALKLKEQSEAIKLKEEAIKLREDRERKFLEEKYRKMDTPSGSIRSHCTETTSRSEFIHDWIEDQRKQLKARSMDEIVHPRMKNLEPLSSVWSDDPRPQLKSRSVGERVRHYKDQVDLLNFNLSIPLDEEERQQLIQIRTAKINQRIQGQIVKTDQVVRSQSGENNPANLNTAILKAEASTFAPNQIPTTMSCSQNHQPIASSFKSMQQGEVQSKVQKHQPIASTFKLMHQGEVQSKIQNHQPIAPTFKSMQQGEVQSKVQNHQPIAPTFKSMQQGEVQSKVQNHQPIASTFKSMQQAEVQSKVQNHQPIATTFKPIQLGDVQSKFQDQVPIRPPHMQSWTDPLYTQTHQQMLSTIHPSYDAKVNWTNQNKLVESTTGQSTDTAYRQSRPIVSTMQSQFMRPPMSQSYINTLDTSDHQTQPFVQSYQSMPPSFNVPPQSIHSSYHSSQPMWQSASNGNRSGGMQTNSIPRPGYVRRALTTDQIAARHATSKELPKFRGNPGEWSRFITRFENTTNMCGYSEDENLERLDKCLEGNARNIVEWQLTLPECVPEIIETLKQKFGRPENVIKSILAELRKQPPIKLGNLEALSIYGYKVRNACKTIEKEGLYYHLYNPELTQELVDKLPHQTKVDWARYSENVPQITLVTLSDWMYNLSRSLNRIMPSDTPASSKDTSFKDRKTDQKTDNTKNGYINVHDSDKSTEKKSTCVACSKECKFIGECKRFKEIGIEERWKVLIKNGLCRRCLRRHGRTCHTSKDCGVNGCIYKHHPLLHNMNRHSKENSRSVNQSNKIKDKKPTPANNSEGTVTPTGISNTHILDHQQELFRIVPVELHHNERSVKTFAFLDEGSSFTLMERQIAEELALKGIPETICLMWTKKVHRQEESEQVNLEISGLDEPNKRYSLRSVNLVDDLNLPMQSLLTDTLMQRFDHLKDLPLIGYENATPTILIGLKHARLTTPLETVEGHEEDPIATRSRLGWSVHGPMNHKTQGYVNLHRVKKCPCQDRDDDIHKLIKDHFTVENFGVMASSVSADSKQNEKALKLLKATTIRKDKRFETRLLWKNESCILPDNYTMAKSRLTCLESKGSKVVNTINEAIADYQSKGYVTKLSPAEAAKKHKRTWYLPLFTVSHPKKPEKLRTVFDAAAKVGGVSLNSVLFTGPDLLVSIVDVLRRFRENRIAICGDIREMYHQVLVHNEDRHSQRFLWRNGDKDREPDVYVMNVMTFGATCSPSAAQYVKNLNASEFQDQYPRAVEAIVNNHYVDDMMDGADSVEEAIQLVNDVKLVHSQGGFEIRNFKSNSPDVLKAIGQLDNSDLKVAVENGMKTERVLGMFWDTKEDCFTFSLQFTKVTTEVLTGKRLPTKREMLKLLMSIFDPLGLLSYYLIHLKILLQDVWRSKISWDDPLPENLKPKWERWIKILPNVENLNIPRWYSANLAPAESKKIELHIFVDASEDAFAAAAYLRIETGKICECSLIGSKARVTPLKYMSIPRKELMASLLGTRFSKSIRDGLTVKIDRRVIWSDSITVLTWLHSEHQKYSQFVAHRVGEILENTDLYEWRWVPTKLNVADEATKWSKTPTFESTDRWFTGPDFLKLDESEWPKQPQSIVPNGTNEEMKLSCAHARLVMSSIVDSSRFSKWQRVVRAVAFAIRWGRKLLSKVRKSMLPQGPLTQEELLTSEKLLFCQAQWEGFTDEMITLVRNKQVEPKRQTTINVSSSIYDCSPYLDESGVMRVKGRIDNATAISSDAKRPIILPRNNQLTKLVMLSYHTKLLHRNHETAINELKQRFYVPRMRVAFRTVRWNCKLCELKRSIPHPPQIADLPGIRFEIGVRPFTYTGIDYFGPINVMVGRRVEKRWGVLLTCLTVRAVHIEIAHSLSTESCIKSIRNFINYRGRPREFYSDNGTCFKGADKELKNELEKLNVEELSTKYTSSYTKWNFNPPACPHMGGCWERLIRTVKTCMKQPMMPRIPKDEDLRSLLLEVMNIVNSRPLTHIPLDSSESEALTPNHFILGSSNGIKPPGEFTSDGPYLRSGWKEIQRCTNIFWKRFINEYIPTLTRKSKWFDKVKPLEVGDLVLSSDESYPRNTYSRARVVDTIIGSNGQVRRAEIKFADGKTLWRPAVKLAVLDVNETAPTKRDSLDRSEAIETGGNNVGATILNFESSEESARQKDVGRDPNRQQSPIKIDVEEEEDILLLQNQNKTNQSAKKAKQIN